LFAKYDITKQFYFLGLTNDEFVIQGQERVIAPHELKVVWLYRQHRTPLTWAFIQTMYIIHAQHMKHYGLSPSNTFLNVFIITNHGYLRSSN
jgi:hypothetical protein